MINKLEPFPTWSTFIAEFSQKNARQTYMDEFTGLYKGTSDGIRARRVLKALNDKKEGGEKI